MKYGTIDKLTERSSNVCEKVTWQLLAECNYIKECKLTSKGRGTFELRTKRMLSAHQPYNQWTPWPFGVRFKFWTCKKMRKTLLWVERSSPDKERLYQTRNGRDTHADGWQRRFSVGRSLTPIRCNVTDALVYCLYYHMTSQLWVKIHRKKKVHVT